MIYNTFNPKTILIGVKKCCLCVLQMAILFSCFDSLVRCQSNNLSSCSSEDVSEFIDEVDFVVSSKKVNIGGTDYFEGDTFILYKPEELYIFKAKERSQSDKENMAGIVFLSKTQFSGFNSKDFKEEHKVQFSKEDYENRSDIFNPVKIIINLKPALVACFDTFIDPQKSDHVKRESAEKKEFKLTYYNPKLRKQVEMGKNSPQEDKENVPTEDKDDDSDSELIFDEGEPMISSNLEISKIETRNCDKIFLQNSSITFNRCKSLILWRLFTGDSDFIAYNNLKKDFTVRFESKRTNRKGKP